MAPKSAIGERTSQFERIRQLVEFVPNVNESTWILMSIFSVQQCDAGVTPRSLCGDCGWRR